jgi:hypothetical protein
MGTLMGHIIPGSCFLLTGFVYLWVMLHRYFKWHVHDATCDDEDKYGGKRHRQRGPYQFSSALNVAFPGCDKCESFPVFSASLVCFLFFAIIGKYSVRQISI